MWQSKSLGLKVGERLEYVGTGEMRNSKWKEGLWLRKGVIATIIKLNNGHSARPDIISEDFPEGIPESEAWATAILDGDKDSKIAISKLNITNWMMIEEVED